MNQDFVMIGDTAINPAYIVSWKISAERRFADFRGDRVRTITVLYTNGKEDTFYESDADALWTWLKSKTADITPGRSSTTSLADLTS